MTLTDRGPRRARRSAVGPDAGGDRQAFYAGIAKPRELAHDSRLYSAYVKAAERLAERGDRVRRVVLEDELKREYQRFLQAPNRGAPRQRRHARSAMPRPSPMGAASTSCRTTTATCSSRTCGIEYEDRDGRRAVEDIEVVTPHYRGAHAAAKARSGFTRYRAAGARVGGLRTTGTERARRRPAPGRGAAAMTLADRVHAVAEQGFTERQAGFLVTVHAALRRLRRPPVLRLRAASSTARRRTTSSPPWWPRQLATPYTAAHRRARIYHVHGKPLYARDRRAGQPPPQARSRWPAPSSG